MTHQAEIEEKFWKSLKSDRTAMLALSGGDAGLAQPMTALFLDGRERGPIYFFTASDTELVQELGDGRAAILNFADKGHDLFASIEGRLSPDNDPATIDALWNRFVAAWFEGGRDDPKLRLLRFEPRDAQIWLNENSVFAGIKLLMGRDPKDEYKDKVAETRLS